MAQARKSSSAPADRGKWAEKEVQKFFQSQADRFAMFSFERLPDARAAMGRFKAMVADFDIGRPGLQAFVEVKETQHPYRLAKDKLEQLPRLRMWALAGREFAVIVYHSELNGWRIALKDFFGLDGMPASWDLRELPVYPTAEEALRSTGWFR